MTIAGWQLRYAGFYPRPFKCARYRYDGFPVGWWFVIFCQAFILHDLKAWDEWEKTDNE